MQGDVQEKKEMGYKNEKLWDVFVKKVEEIGEELIDSVNGLLEDLRKFPGGLFEIRMNSFFRKKICYN